MPSVKVYGADWCPMTKAALGHLDKLGVDYDYIDIDEDREAAAWVAAHAGGKERKPTIDIDGRVLVAPSNRELDRALGLNSSAVGV